jgi:hypothetical protein
MSNESFGEFHPIVPSTTCSPRPVPCATLPRLPCTPYHEHVSCACGTCVGGAWLHCSTTRRTSNHPSHFSSLPTNLCCETLFPPPPVPCALYRPPAASMHATLCIRIVCMWYACEWRLVCLHQHQSHCQPPLPLFLSAHQSVLRNALPSTTSALCPVPPTCCFHARYTMHTYHAHAAHMWAVPGCTAPPPAAPPTTPPTFPLCPPICVAKRSSLHHQCPVPCTAHLLLPCTLHYAYVSCACGTRVNGALFAHTSTNHTANHPSHSSCLPTKLC